MQNRVTFQESFHGVLYRSLQRMRGRPIGPLVERLQGWERLPPAEFRRLVRERIAETLTRAQRDVPLYRRGEWLSTRVDELASWPVLERETLREQNAALRARSLPRGSFERHSSGSTGPQLRVAIDPRGAAWSWASEYRALLWHEIPIGVRTLMMWGGSPWLIDWIRNRKLLRTTELSAERLAEAVSWLERHRAPLGWGHPSAFFQLARFVRAEQAGRSEPLLPHVKLGGEQVFPFQREEIARALGSRCIESYGCTEVGAIAGECPAGSLHVYAEHVHLEVLRGDRPVPAGERGDLVATSLTNRAMPLVRCRIGDRGRLLPDPCRCGLALPVLADLQGRVSDLLLAADGRPVHGSALGHALPGLLARAPAAAVREILFEQHSPQHWQVLVEGRAELDAALLRGIEELVQGLFGRGCRVEVRAVARIPREASGKYRYYRAAPAEKSTRPGSAP